MAFTREYIRNAAKESGVEIPKELEDALVQEHLSARDAYANAQVKSALEENKPEPPAEVKDSQEYKELKKQFDAYKAAQDAKETRAAKEKAVRAYLESKNIKDGNLTIAMRGISSEIDAAELDGDNLKDTKVFDDLIAGEYAGLVTTTTERGAPPPANPPKNTGGKMSRDEILKIKDPTARQAAIAENHELFGI